jgi:hypothetical protein
MINPSGEAEAYIRRATADVLYNVDEHFCSTLTDSCVAAIEFLIHDTVRQNYIVHLFEPHVYQPVNTYALLRAALNQSFETAIRESGSPRGALAQRVADALEDQLVL